ncbi:metal ABC transporter ATP-binding protein [Myxococcota bacterium]|nr:metal ABC transporter ATP-binding protein [Myxococcota bacterium]
MAERAARPLVEITKLVITRGAVSIFDGLDLSVGPGTIHAIVGPNGAGKSTLVGAILGEVAFDGAITLRFSRSKRVGYVPQRFVIERTLPLTVRELVALGRQRRPTCFGVGRRVRAEVEAILASVGLAHVAERPAGGLSGGELQRVLLASAAEPAPELLVLDEPATGLDVASSQVLEAKLVELRARGETTVLVVSHDLEQVERIADRVTVIDRGVVADGAPRDVLAAAKTRVWPARSQEAR